MKQYDLPASVIPGLIQNPEKHLWILAFFEETLLFFILVVTACQAQ